jgi:hypothetical protein
LPVKAEVLNTIGKAPGETVMITLLERISPIRKTRNESQS